MTTEATQPDDSFAGTPGPWECRRLIDTDGKPYSTLYEAHIAVGPCMIWAPAGNTEQEANAKLIAAAPELADALRELHDFAVPDSTCRHNRSQIAFVEAAELLKRVGY